MGILLWIYHRTSLERKTNFDLLRSEMSIQDFLGSVLNFFVK